MPTLNRCVLGLVLGLTQMACGANALGGAWLFADRNPTWEAGPPDLGYQTAVGTVTLFRSDGQLLRLSCQLYRDSETSPVAVELKSGYTVSIGHWRVLADEKLEIKLRLVTAEKVGTPINKSQPLPGDEKTEMWTMTGGDSPSNAKLVITSQGEQRPLSSIKNRSEFDRLVKRYLR
jgi:hypothetical protein